MDKSTEKLLKFLGRNIRTIRTRKGISLETISDAVDLSLEIMYRIERGEYELELKHLGRLSAYLGESPADLLHKRY